MALPKMVLNSNIVHQVDILDIHLVTQFFDTIYFYMILPTALSLR